MRCPSCGREIREESRFCEHCGRQVSVGVQSTQPLGPPVAQPPRKKSNVALVIGVTIVAIVVILAVIFLALYSMGSHATIVLNVHSTHILYSVECYVFVGDKQIASGTLDPGYYATFTDNVYWPSKDPTTVRVSATSTGGGLGSQSDYYDLTMEDGYTYTVDLYV